MHCPTFTNVYWNLNIKKILAAQGDPLNRGAPCRGIIGILVNPALHRAVKLVRVTKFTHSRVKWISQLLTFNLSFRQVSLYRCDAFLLWCLASGLQQTLCGGGLRLCCNLCASLLYFV